jgi:hypothetical protein
VRYIRRSAIYTSAVVSAGCLVSGSSGIVLGDGEAEGFEFGDELAQATVVDNDDRRDVVAAATGTSALFPTRGHDGLLSCPVRPAPLKTYFFYRKSGMAGHRQRQPVGCPVRT